jgi:16S rRNA (adenine(1408)-N(1))-methyltransferase
MESVQGKRSVDIGADHIASLARAHAEVLVDLGTGDGRFVLHAARARSDCFAIGVDACRENLRATSRTAPSNAIYLIANALDLPPDLDGLAHHVTINFPWGSLLRGLLDGEPSLMCSLDRVAASDAVLDVRLNAGALAEVGWTLETGADRIRCTLAAGGFKTGPIGYLDNQALRWLPSTWAKRLAFGRDPRGLLVPAVMGVAWKQRREGPACRAPPVRGPRELPRSFPRVRKSRRAVGRPGSRGRKRQPRHSAQSVVVVDSPSREVEPGLFAILHQRHSGRR